VTVLAVGLLLAGGLQLLGSAQAAQQARDAGTSFPADRAVWLPIAGVLYGASGLALLSAAIGLWLMRRWGWWLALVAPLVASGVQWGLRLLLERSGYALASRPADAALTALGLALAWLVLWWPRVRRRFMGRLGD
jgi:hypothetical protein